MGWHHCFLASGRQKHTVEGCQQELVMFYLFNLDLPEMLNPTAQYEVYTHTQELLKDGEET